jgi:hypothetical protein
VEGIDEGLRISEDFRGRSVDDKVERVGFFSGVLGHDDPDARGVVRDRRGVAGVPHPADAPSARARLTRRRAACQTFPKWLGSRDALDSS